MPEKEGARRSGTHGSAPASRRASAAAILVTVFPAGLALDARETQSPVWIVVVPWIHKEPPSAFGIEFAYEGIEGEGIAATMSLWTVGARAVRA
jgi:hypothetical protein